MIQLCIALCAIILLQQIYYLWQIQKLVDKTMSASYYDYQRAKSLKPIEKKPDRKPDLQEAIERGTVF